MGGTFAGINIASCNARVAFRNFQGSGGFPLPNKVNGLTAGFEALRVR